MKITFIPLTGEYLATASFFEKDQLKMAGFRWDASRKQWYTRDKDVAQKLRQHFDAVATQKLREETQAQAETKKLSNSFEPTPGFHVPVPAGVKLMPHQISAVEFALSKQNVLIADDMGLGKEQHVDSPVLTPTGWKKIGEMKVGSKIIGGSTGKTQTITGVFPQGIKQLYRVTFNDGTSTLCGKEHLWAVRDSNGYRRDRGFRVFSLEKIMEMGLGKEGMPRWEIPLPPAIEFPAEKLEVDPYLLGTLIGNGSLLSIPRISTRHKQQLEIIKPLLPEGIFIGEAPASDPNIHGLTTQTNMGGANRNPLTRALKEIGVWGKKDYEKTIPEKYLKGTAQDRLALLQGLLDTDGGAMGPRVRFSSSSKELAEQVMDLVRSLGGRATMGEQKPYGNGTIPCYSIVIQLPGFQLFRLDYHLQRQKVSKTRVRKTIISVEPEFEAEAVCIRVDDPEHLYITDDYIVTHNTASSICVINKTTPKKTLIICPASLKLNWKNELATWLVNPQEYTIKILDTKKPRDIGTGTNIIYIVNYDIISRFEFSDIDLMILDESHKLKNSKTKARLHIWGGRKKMADGSTACFQKIQAKRTIAMTGTPICNRPSELWTHLQALIPDKMKGIGYLPWHIKHCAGVQTNFGWDFSGASNLEELNDFLRSNLMIRRTKQDVLKDLPEKTRKVTTLEPPAGVSKLLLQEGALQEILDKGIKNASDEAKDVIAKLVAQSSIQKAGAEEVEQTAVGILARIRKEIGVVKAPLVASYAKELMETQECLVIMAHHRDVVDLLEKELEEFGVSKLVGGMKVEDKQQAVDNFQSGKNKIFIGSITAAGVGITLTKAYHTLFAEVDWVPGNLAQAEDRTNRMGQKNACTSEYLVFEGSIDRKMIDTVDQKNTVINTITR